MPVNKFPHKALPFQDPCIPPDQRCTYRTDKESTGPFKRKDLLDFLERKAKEEKDWEEFKPYTKEIRGTCIYVTFSRCKLCISTWNKHKFLHVNTNVHM